MVRGRQRGRRSKSNRERRLNWDQLMIKLDFGSDLDNHLIKKTLIIVFFLNLI